MNEFLLYASFSDAQLAEKAVGALLDHHVKVEDINLVFDEGYKYDKEKNIVQRADVGITTTTGSDAASGAAKGAGIGLGLGALAAVASLLIPGFGLVIGGGALATALGAAAGTAMGGAIAGGVAGYLTDQGMDAKVAQDYKKALENGGALIAVTYHPGSSKVELADIQKMLVKYSATDVRIVAPVGRR